jgi:hypothetical protein
MRMPDRVRRTFRVASFAFAMLFLAACAAPAPNGDTQAGAAKADAASSAAAKPAPQPAQAAPPAPKETMRTGGPLPPDPVDEQPGSKPGIVDTGCRTDADCAVKNVGSCCGYAPACVNVNSPTDPKGVQAECAKKGMSSVCGFPEISSCSCKQGRCEAATGGQLQ